jgi:hypothetical protein
MQDKSGICRRRFKNAISHADSHAIQKAPIKSCRASAVQKSIAKSDEMSLVSDSHDNFSV